MDSHGAAIEGIQRHRGTMCQGSIWCYCGRLPHGATFYGCSNLNQNYDELKQLDHPSRGRLSKADELLRTLEAKEMKQRIKLLDVVALTEDLPKRRLRRGQVGTVVPENALTQGHPLWN